MLVTLENLKDRAVVIFKILLEEWRRDIYQEHDKEVIEAIPRGWLAYNIMGVGPHPVGKPQAPPQKPSESTETSRSVAGEGTPVKRVMSGARSNIALQWGPR